MQVYGHDDAPSERCAGEDDMQEDVCFELERTRGGASLVLNDSLHRLLAHAVCLYHSIQVCSAGSISVHRPATKR